MPHDAFLANAHRVSLEAYAEAMAPPPPPDYNAWAVRNVRFGQESDFPGPYDPARFPWNRRILECFSPEHPANVIVLRKSAQIGGTVVAQVFLLGSADMLGGDFGYYHPTLDNAARWSKGKFKQMLKGTAANLFVSERSRDGASSVFYKELRDGSGALRISGSNSAAGLSQDSLRKQVQDDLAKWETENEGGDPETQADSRSSAYIDAKVFKNSTPLVWPGCRITVNFKRGTEEHWHIPCGDCGESYWLDVVNLILPHVDEESPDTVEFPCPHCGVIQTELKARGQMAKGQWVAHNPNPEPGVVSFHLNAFYAPHMRWGRLMRRWLTARGNPLAEQAVYNDVFGLPYEVKGNAPSWEKLRDRHDAVDNPYGFDRGVIPAGAPLIIGTADVQGDRVEVRIAAYGPNLSSYTVQHIVVPGFIGTAEAQAELDRILASTWPTEAGGRQGLDLFGIDSKGYTADVWAWASRHPESKVVLLQGIAGDTKPPIERAKNRLKQRNGRTRPWSKRVWMVGGYPLKASLYKRLVHETPQQIGYCGFARGLGDSWYQQLTVERRTKKRSPSGRESYLWTKPEHEANEAHDLTIYGDALAHLKQWVTMTPEQWSVLLSRQAPAEEGQLDLEAFALKASPAGDAAPVAPAGEAQKPNAVRSTSGLSDLAAQLRQANGN
ncbi:phage terminase large subunit family protein [Adonisia turfae]